MAQKAVPTRFSCLTSSQNTEARQYEMVVKSFTEPSELFFVILKDNWSRSSVVTGDVLHIFNPTVEDVKTVDTPVGKCARTLVVDNSNGLFILNPDLLLTTTTIMGTSHCMRKQWIQSMFSIWGESSLPLVLGSAAHEVFQEGLRKKIYSVEGIRNIFYSDVLKTLTRELYALGMSKAEFITAIEPYFISISKWLQLYMKPQPSNAKDKKHFTVKRVNDIENEIWSIKYGVIGKMDITMEAVLTDGNGDQKLLPLELKTGKHTFSPAHMGQVILYSYIIQEKYRQNEPNDGYLIYLKDDVRTEVVKSNYNVFRDILILRNTFQVFHNKIMDQSSKIDNIRMRIPERITNTRSCERCEFLTECSLFYNSFETKDEVYSPNNIFDAAVSHLSTSDIEFFAKNITLLEVEKQYAIHKEQMEQFWNISSEDCEKSGRGFAKVEIELQKEDILRMRRTKKAKMTPILGGLIETSTGVPVNYSSLIGRRVMVNEEILVSKACFAIFGNYCRQTSCAFAFIEKFNEDYTEVTLRLEKEIITELNSKSIYRIDILHLNSQRPMHTNFANIARLMSPNDERCRELRDIVIRGSFPRNNINTSILVSLQKVINSPIVQHLNNNQKRATIGVLRTRCSLIFGSPGSGKTETIVALIRVLHSLGFSVLVTSFTHVAVDNILLKLLKSNQANGENVDFLRIGALSRINEGVRDYSETKKTEKWMETGNVEALSSYYRSVQVVASTALGVAGHTIFQKRQFDYCILDEASQVVMATCLGPLFMSRNFVLVGDQKQLPPVVQNAHSKKEGLEESLFSRLLHFVDKNESDIKEYVKDFDDDLIADVILKGENSPVKKNRLARPDSIRVFPLFIQYRMNREIMSLPNDLTYSGQLTCGNKDIEEATLLTYLKDTPFYQEDYLAHALSPQLMDSVVFLDTDKIMDACENMATTKATKEDDKPNDGLFGSKKSQTGFVHNEFEAKLIVRLVHQLLAVYGTGGLTAAHIGVVSPFRKQVARIKELMGEELISKRLEINTVDQYQGRDKEVIIYSCVKSHVQMDVQDSGIEPENDDDSQISAVSTGSGGSGSESTVFRGVIDSELLKDERRLNVAITRAKKKLIIVGNRSTLNRYEPFRNLFTSMRQSMFYPLCNEIKDESSLL